jgi:serine/threonine-protein kinase RsbW
MGQLFHDVTLSDLGQIRHYIRAQGTASGCQRAVVDELVVAANEALANIVRHCYQDQPGPIEVTVVCNTEMVKVILFDQGPPFDPTAVPAPDTTLPLEQRPFGGVGVHMMRDFCDELNYRQDARGRNELTLLKRFNH